MALRVHLILPAKLGNSVRVAAVLLALGPSVAVAQTTMPHRGAPSGGITPHATAWCTGFRLATLSPRARLEGANLQRLQAAQGELAPGFAAGDNRTGLDLLAGYQEQLEKSRPDSLLAASYLALVSAVPINLARIRLVNALLCVSTTKSMASRIATQAEAERKQLAR
jgi:hypothetical protein